MNVEDIEVPEDLGIKMGTPEEQAWTMIKDGAEKEKSQCKRMILMNDRIIQLADEMIEKEKSLNSNNNT